MSESPPPSDSGVSHRLGRAARQVIITVVGVAVTVVGVALLVLPGPGLLLVVAGLAILATEYRWARRLYVYTRERSRTAVKGARDRVEARRHSHDRTSSPSTIDLTDDGHAAEQPDSSAEQPGGPTG